jgi:hypothetical protein
VIEAIGELMRHETAGDPVTGLKWTRRTTRKIAEELGKLGIAIGRNTVGRLLKEMRFSLRVNRKKLAGTVDPDRDEQFKYIGALRDSFEKLSCPVISVDTKKKEVVGLFKNNGTAWARESTAVNDHDFRSMAVGMAIPYGVYDTVANRGSLFIGASHDTPEFAVDCIEKWWRSEGRKRYGEATGLLILADGGGSNGHRSRVWKRDLQEKLCDRHGLSVTVSHYPPGTSKWNPIEHRLFSEISKNWAGRPLDSYETIVQYARTTTTTTGLKVTAHRVKKRYKKAQTVPNARIKALNLVRHTVLPKWNYTLRPSDQRPET